MGLLDKLFDHMSKHGKSPQKHGNDIFSFEDNVDKKIKARIYFTEATPRHILGYTGYHPLLKGEADKIARHERKLLSRNSRMLGTSFARTNRGYVIKGDFHASDDDETSMRQGEDLWLSLKEPFKDLQRDLNNLKRSGVKFKK